MVFSEIHTHSVSSVEKWPNQGSRGLNLTAHPHLETVNTFTHGDPIHRLYI